MELAFRTVLLFITATIFWSAPVEASIFDQKDGQVPKWSRLYLRFGRATGEMGEAPKSLSVNSFGYIKMRGQFGYGADYSYLYIDGLKIDSTAVVMTLRPDWNLEAEPSLHISYGLASVSSADVSKEGKGSNFTVGLSLDLLKGPFYSTSVGVQNTSLRTDSIGAPNSSFQSVTFSVNVDLY